MCCAGERGPAVGLQKESHVAQTVEHDAAVDQQDSHRRRSALALIAGALVMGLLVQTKVIAFYHWTPLIVGLTYLTAAAVAGRRAALWAPGIITTCWGIAVALGMSKVITIDTSVSYYIAGAVGVAVALALRFSLGVAAGPVGMVVSIAVLLAHPVFPNLPSWIFQGATFAVVLGAWGLWELRPSGAKAAAVSAGTVPSSAPEPAFGDDGQGVRSSSGRV